MRIDRPTPVSIAFLQHTFPYAIYFTGIDGLLEKLESLSFTFEGNVKTAELSIFCWNFHYISSLRIFILISFIHCSSNISRSVSPSLPYSVFFLPAFDV